MIVRKRRARSNNHGRYPSQKLYHEMRAAAARLVLDGYPIEEPFKTSEDVERYLNADHIICLRCGKSYKELSTHLRACHQWTVDQYKEFYRLPARVGLTSAPRKKDKREFAFELIEVGALRMIHTLTSEEREEIEAKRKKAGRRHTSYKRLTSTENLGDHCHGKLTSTEVLDIRSRRLRVCDFARQYDLSPATVVNIQQRSIYKEVA